MSLTPGSIFHARYIPTVDTVSVPKNSTLQTSRRELSENLYRSVIGTLFLDCRAIELGKPPQREGEGDIAVHRRIRYVSSFRFALRMHPSYSSAPRTFLRLADAAIAIVFGAVVEGVHSEWPRVLPGGTHP